MVDELPDGSLLQSGLRQVEALVRPTSATEAEVTLRATTDGKIVGSASFTKGRGWTVKVEGTYDLRANAGEVEAKLVYAR